MTTHELIERIEGEAHLDFKTAGDGTVEEVNVRFPHFRGMEMIMQGRSALDALVLTPRVCGICGHSHLISAVQMLESIYRDSGAKLVISTKARTIRRITLQSELLQSHLKWLYLIMLPESAKLSAQHCDLSLKALYAASQANTLAALFSGQWPHSSYAIPGGVTCDPTYVEVMQGQKIVSELERFLETQMLGCSMEHFEAMRCADTLLGLKGDAGKLLRNVEAAGLLEAGKSHGRFLSLGDKSVITASGERTADATLVSEAPAYAPYGETYAKNALYAGEFFETGPLARALVRNSRMVAALKRDFGDSTITRLVARIAEIVILTKELRFLLDRLDLNEPSFIPPPAIDYLSGEGSGIVEAPRGTLIHRASVEKGKITSYSIITPTQWNLGNGTLQTPGIAQKAMIGLPDRAKASFVFRTFDVCSVCTTH